MKIPAILLVLAASIAPLLRANPVTVEQLEHVLVTSRTLYDADLAHQLSTLELTERLSSARVSRYRASLPGPKSQNALLALADVSAFLDPPPGELASTPPPSLAEQRQMMSLVVTFAGRILSRLPNFYATRETTRFANAPVENGAPPAETAVGLHAVSISRATVLYHEGREVIEQAKASKPKPAERGLTSWGAFGPILGTVLVDASQSQLTWAYWQQGAAGSEAVFRYKIPRDKSHYEVRFCCVVESYGLESKFFREFSGYHGEITIDPVSGTVVRVTLEAELEPTAPVLRAAMMVEYSPVDIGGMTYICPLRSVSLSRARTLRQAQDSSGHTWTTMGSEQTLLNHSVFGQYHLMRGDSRVLSAGEERAAGLNSDASAAGIESEHASETVLEDASAMPPSPDPSSTNLPVESKNALTLELPPEPAPPADPEISFATLSGLPDALSRPHPATPDTGFTLRTTTHLVDIGVVAFDKKGRPVTDLKREDFVILDNGKKQQLKFFSQAGLIQRQGAPASAPSVAPNQEVFSNRRLVAADAKPEKTSESTTILLIDSSNLAFGDLTYARAEILRFLKSQAQDEPVALYVMKNGGFQILVEPNANHDLLAAKLAAWMPSAIDLAHAQEEEQRNRQQFENVHSYEDLLRVNGQNPIGAEQTQLQPVDPALRDNGDNPGRRALSIMVGVARHLAAIPGHKSLVWVTSDNVLADWSDRSISLDKGSKFIEPFALHAQEAMNDAHVSVYPLDASQLEAGSVDASIANRNVELDPATKENLSMMMTQSGGGASSLKGLGPEAQAGGDISPNRNPQPGRVAAQMQQDAHSIQGSFREVAEATGGRALRRSGDIATELGGIVADGRAAYLISFTPDMAPDGKYHLLTVKLAGRRDVALRYRTGYVYEQEAATLKERFRDAIWRPADISEIGVSAVPAATGKDRGLKLNIAATDLQLAQDGEHWTDKIDIFLVERDDAGLHAKVTGQTMGLRLKPATYQTAMRDGIAFDQRIESKQESGSVRLVVVDENSGRMGSITLPVRALQPAP